MRFSPAENSSRSSRNIGLLAAELGAPPRFSASLDGQINVGALERELERARPLPGSPGPTARKRKPDRASEPARALAADLIAGARSAPS